MESSCPTKSPPPSVSDSSADSAMTFTDEGEGERDAIRAYTRVEERLEFVLFQISDYLAENGRQDLFRWMTMRDLAAMIYHPEYIRWLNHQVPESML